MKTKMLCGVLIGMLALAGQTMGAVYTDAATNYPGGSWTNGSNGGTGFQPWSIVADPGVGGWAGAGIWDSTVAELMMGEAFGYVGKVGYVAIDRSFNQALNTNDVFEFDFGVNWDSDGGNKGFSLYSAGGEVINVNHGSFPGFLTMNGVNALTNYGTNTMHWTFTQVASNKIGVQATGRDGVETLSTTVTTVAAYGYVGALRFYSAGLASNAVDARQSYFNNLKLTQEGTPPPDPNTLEFTQGTWNPTATGPYPFTLTRGGATGTNLVLTSSNTNAVTVPSPVNFVAGSNSVSFNVTVVSLTAGSAMITASNPATGLIANYVITPVAPTLQITGDAVQSTTGPKTYTLVRSASVGTNILLSSSDTGVATVPASLNFPANVYTSTFTVTFSGTFGPTTLSASNAASGAAGTFAVTYLAPKLTILGLTRSWVGGGEIYRVIREGAVGDNVNLSMSVGGVLTIPVSVTFGTGEDTATFQANCTGAGTTVLTASNADATSAGVSVTVAATPDLAAYDDASLYGGTWTLAPAHDSGFPAWTEELSPEIADSYRGAFIGTALVPGINVADDAFGLYANYYNDPPGTLPEIKLRRSFPAAMTTGQVFSVDVAYNWSSGTKGFRLTGNFEGTDYERFELYNSGGDTWSYQLDDGAPVVVWSNYIAGGFVGRVQVTCTAPNTFTFSFLREGDAAPTVVASVGLPGGIDRIELYNYNGGTGDAENFTFNRLWLSTVPGGGPGPGIESARYNPATRQLTLTVPSDKIPGTVQGADCVVVGQAFVWSNLVLNTDYSVSGSNVIVNSAAPMPSRRLVRIGLLPAP